MRNLDIEIYADEIVMPLDYNNKTKNFIALGVLFVPVNNRSELVKDLSNNRCLFEKNNIWVWNHEDCPHANECKKHWHDSNNSEIHHQQIRNARASNSLKEISQKWMKYLISCNKAGNKPIYFNLLYVDLDKLEITNFGQEKTHENIYNKFFRTALSYGIKAFFANSNVIIKRVYHDKGSMEFHTYFPHLNLQKLTDTLEDGTRVLEPEICFVDSDHRTYLDSSEKLYEQSNLIQFIDLILGTFTQNIYYLSNDILKKRLAMVVRPLVSRLIDNSNNKNSSYNYYGRQKISFFPKYLLPDSKNIVKNLQGNFIEEHKAGQFHTDKKLEMTPFDEEQNNLLQFF